jgi:hypothetical protein
LWTNAFTSSGLISKMWATSLDFRSCSFFAMDLNKPSKASYHHQSDISLNESYFYSTSERKQKAIFWNLRPKTSIQLVLSITMQFNMDVRRQGNK